MCRRVIFEFRRRDLQLRMRICKKSWLAFNKHLGDRLHFTGCSANPNKESLCFATPSNHTSRGSTITEIQRNEVRI